MSDVVSRIDEVAVVPPESESPTIERLRGVLFDARLEEGGRDELERLVLEVIGDLLDAAVMHDWSDVGGVEVEAREGMWKATLRIAREDDLGAHACTRRHARTWR